MSIQIPKPKEKALRTVQANIDYLCDVQGVSVEALRLAARLSPYQYRERRKNPELYTFGDLRKIANRLHTTVCALLEGEKCPKK